MTDTLNKNTESCTMNDTPETDAILNQFEHLLPNWLAFEMAAVARKLERERDEAKEHVANLEIALTAAIRSANERQKETEEARFDLSFSRDLYKLHEFQSDELRKQLAEAVSSCNIWQAGHSKLVEDRDEWKSFAVKLENAFKLENDTLRKDLEHAKSYKKVMKEQHKQLTSRLEVLHKNNAKLLTTIQENGLAEYGN